MKFVVPAFISFGLFIVASIVQLVFAFLEKENLRRKEKFLSLFFLAFFAFFALPNQPLIYCGCILGMLGDILDLQPRTFKLGVVCFYLGHLCYIFEILWVLFNFNIEYYFYILFIAVNLITYFLMYEICRKKTFHSKADSFGQSMYFAILVTYLPILIYATIVHGGNIYLSLIGACFFIISDSILVKTHFGRKFKRHHFYVMSTYLTAEALIVVGLIVTLIH